MRDLLALPAHLGGLGIFDPCKKSTRQYSSCETISEPLVGLILDQAETLTSEVIADQERMRKNARKVSRQYETRSANELKENLPNKLQKAHTVCSEKGASSWLTVLPILSMYLHCIKGPSGMLCAYDMGGVLHTFTLTVFVGMVLLSSMRLAAREVDFHRSDTMRSVTSLPTY